MKTRVQGTKSEITGFSMEWTFDAMTTMYMLDGVDLSAENRKASLQTLADEMLANMVEDNYFTHFGSGGDSTNYKHAENVSLSIQRTKAVLTFDLPLSKPSPLRSEPLELSIYEPGHFVDMSWKQNADITLSPSIASGCTFEVIAPNPTEEQMSYALALPMDAEADNSLGKIFTQKVLLRCNKKDNSTGEVDE